MGVPNRGMGVPNCGMGVPAHDGPQAVLASWKTSTITPFVLPNDLVSASFRPRMTNLHSDIHFVRRLGRLMLILTVLLACVLAMYAWPLIHSWLFSPSGQPRPITPRGDLMGIE